MNKEISYQERHEREQKKIKYATAGLLGFAALMLASGSILKNYSPESTPHNDDTESAIDVLYDVTIGDEFNKADQQYEDNIVKEAIIKQRLEKQSENASSSTNSEKAEIDFKG
jgi:hypothetical protein